MMRATLDRHRKLAADRRRGVLRALLRPLILSLTACGLHDSHVASHAEADLVGMSELNLHLCAGFPTKTETVQGVVLETYETTAAQPNLSVALPSLGPISGGGFGVSGGGSSYCRATFALVDGKITSVHYAGATEVLFGPLAKCAPIVEHCLTERPSADRLVKTPPNGNATAPAAK
jgi:hypothetical protein